MSAPGVAEEPWVTAAIEAGRRAIADDPNDPVDSCYTAEEAIGAALPIIEAGLREKIAREIVEAYRGDYSWGADFLDGALDAAEFVWCSPND